MKREFKVGDRVKAKNGIGTVMELKEHSILVYHENWSNGHNGTGCSKGNYEGNHCWYYNEDSLELLSFTKKDLQAGDKLVLRNGEIGYYDEDMYIDGLKICNIEDDLTNNGCRGESLDIVKVERPIYTTVYEREKQEEQGYKEVRRKANKREYIKLLRTTFNFDRRGDILKVDGVDGNCVYVFAKNHLRDTGKDDYYKWNYLQDEYVVLEGYEPATKEMTVSEISKALGYEVKVVKER